MRITGFLGCLLLSLTAIGCTSGPRETAVSTVAPPFTYDHAAVACVNAHPTPPPLFAGENIASAHAAGRFTVACPMLVDPRVTDWSAAVVAKDDRTISIYFLSGTMCTGVLQRIEVAETQTTVTVSLYLGVLRVAPGVFEAPPGFSCAMYGVPSATVVKLAAPLGNRQLKTPRSDDGYRTFVSHL